MGVAICQVLLPLGPSNQSVGTRPAQPTSLGISLCCAACLVKVDKISASSVDHPGAIDPQGAYNNHRTRHSGTICPLLLNLAFAEKAIHPSFRTTQLWKKTWHRHTAFGNSTEVQ